jgi:hypothetical protein
MAKQLVDPKKKTKKTSEEQPIENNNNILKYYGLPGTNQTIQTYPYLAPEGYIEITDPTPPTKFHILDETGDWKLKDDVSYADKRREAYLKAYDVGKQLEDLYDAILGNHTKLEDMKKTFDEIKQLYPK